MPLYIADEEEFHYHHPKCDFCEKKLKINHRLNIQFDGFYASKDEEKKLILEYNDGLGFCDTNCFFSYLKKEHNNDWIKTIDEKEIL